MRKLVPVLALFLLSSCSSAITGETCDPECRNGETCFEMQCLKGTAQSCQGQAVCRDGAPCVEGHCICGVSSAKPAICSINSACCGQKCIDIKSDPKNCGACGNTCADKQICDNGQCLTLSDVCIDGQQKCSDYDDSILLCFRQKWTSTNTSCPANKMCRNGQCVELSCSDGQKRCFNGNVEICKNDSYTIYTECSPLICDFSTYTCAKPKCADGQKRCDDDGNVETCAKGQWQVSVCEFGTRCDAPKYECTSLSTCTEGAKLCEGNILQTCSDNKWTSYDCGTLTCKDGQCQTIETCTNGTKQCDGNILQTCTSGQWTSYDCGALTCKDGQCQTVATCTEGSFKCEGSELFKCMSAKYVSQRKCASGQTCNASKGICEDGCTNNDTECVGNVYRICQNYAWAETNCGSQTCTSTGCKAASVTHAQDFDKLTVIDTAYAPSSPYEFTDEDIQWTISGRTDMGGKNIEGQGVIMRAGESSYIEATGISKGIGELSFEYKSWGGSSDKGDVKTTAGTVTDTLSYLSTDINVATRRINVNQKAVTGFKIEVTDTGTGRVIIDNVKWTNY